MLVRMLRIRDQQRDWTIWITKTGIGYTVKQLANVIYRVGYGERCVANQIQGNNAKASGAGYDISDLDNETQAIKVQTEKNRILTALPQNENKIEKKKSVIQRTSEIASSGIPFKDRGKLGHYVSCFREDDGTLNYLPGQLWHKGGGVFPCKQSEITSRSLLTTVATWHSFTCTRTTLLTRRSRGCRDN